jgi:hypothetical protein
MYSITLEELAFELLRVGVNPRSIMVEWSVNFVDTDILRHSLLSVGVSDVIPARDNCLGSLMLWRRMLPGCPTLALDLFFCWIFPDSPLRDQHHADIDPEKCRWITIKAFRVLGWIPEAR